MANADQLCERIEAFCSTAEPPLSKLAVGIEAALAFVAAEPAAAQLVCAPAPLEATAIAIAAARRLLIARLAGMLRRGRGSEVGGDPVGIDERLIDASLAFLCARINVGQVERLADLGPELTALLDRPRRLTAMA